jgi:hypothetical protein
VIDDESLELQQEYTLQTEVMLDHCPSILDAVWYSILRFPMIDISTEIKQIANQAACSSGRRMMP